MSSQLRASDPSGVELESGNVQLIMFFAFWSGPSQAMAPLIHALEDQYAEQMIFIYLDIDDPANDFFKKELGFKKEPHFFLLNRAGTILEQWIGYVSMGDFIEAFEIALP
jgi:thiol-disulfide isomerase/thioredoxin